MERKIFWKFNLIDLLLMGMLAISLFALIYKFTWGKDRDKTEDYLFTYVCTAAPQEIFSEIVPGVSCSDGDYGSSLGTLRQVQTSAIEGDTQNLRAVFTCETKGKKAEQGITVGNVVYLKGKRLNFVAGNAVFSVYLSNIQPLKQ